MRRGNCGCLTVLMALLIICLAVAYWPIALGIVVSVGVIYFLYKWISKKKKQNEGQNISVETYKIENNDSELHRNYILNTDNEITLSAGRYIGGRDLNTGIYNLIVISGNGFVETDIPDDFHEYLSCNINNSYNNIEIIQGTVLKVDTGIKIRLYDRRDYITREAIRYSENEKDCNSITFDNMDGHDFEHFCADVLTKSGYQNVQVTRGSGDQGVDIIAERDGIKYAVQCKNYSQPVGNKAVQEIYAGMRFYHCHVGIVMTNNSFTLSAIELAKENGIVLWGRDYLIKFIDENNTILKENGKIIEKDNDFSEKKEGKKNMYDIENGIYPSGHYIVGKNIPKGSYYLTAKKEKIGSVEIYRSISDFKNEENSLIYESFEDDFFLSLNDEGEYLIVISADIRRV